MYAPSLGSMIPANQNNPRCNFVKLITTLRSTAIMDRARNISKSMMSYLKRAREQKEFLLKETKEFERGKRHLANMMGIESQEMTQDDVDKAISYLFPSGLFEKKARPIMKHPDLLYKAQKDAQFNEEGRPHHHLFYTTKPNYYAALGDIRAKLNELNKYEDRQLEKGIVTPPEGSKYTLVGREWLRREQLCERFLEGVNDSERDYLIRSLTALISHPYSSRASQLIEDFTYQLVGQSINLDLPEILKDENTGELYTDLTDHKLAHWVRVKTVLNGTGKFDLDGYDIEFFDNMYTRRSLFFPLQLAGMVDRVDIIANVVKKPISEGQGAIAGIIRLLVSRSIAAYVDPETRERMRLAGLLTADLRARERKKFGQEGARRKYTWKKR